MSTWIFDATLAAGIVLLGWRCLFTHSLFAGVVSFIAFGLLMAIAWVRLDAPDIALVEAAIGAGLTGVLFLDALARIDGSSQNRKEPAGTPGLRNALRGSVLAVAAVAAAGIIGMAAWFLPRPGESAGQQVLQRMGEHPLGNAATAVLLDFRAYDTFLEMAVLALAGLGVLQFARGQGGTGLLQVSAPASSMQRALAALLAPIMLLVAVYLYWSGTSQSGGAFPAGAVLASAAILVFLSDLGPEYVADSIRARATLILGVGAFVVAGLASLVGGASFLEWAPDWTYAAIIAVEGALTVAIGGTLAILYTASARRRSPRTVRDVEADE